MLSLCSWSLRLSWKMHGIISDSLRSKHLITYPIRGNINSSCFCKASFITIIDITITVSIIFIIIIRASIMIRCNHDNYDNNKKVMLLLHKCISQLYFSCCVCKYVAFLCALFCMWSVLILAKPPPICCPIKFLSLSVYRVSAVASCPATTRYIRAVVRTKH